MLARVESPDFLTHTHKKTKEVVVKNKRQIQASLSSDCHPLPSPFFSLRASSGLGVGFVLVLVGFFSLISSAYTHFLLCMQIITFATLVYVKENPNLLWIHYKVKNVPSVAVPYVLACF